MWEMFEGMSLVRRCSDKRLLLTISCKCTHVSWFRQTQQLDSTKFEGKCFVTIWERFRRVSLWSVIIYQKSKIDWHDDFIISWLDKGIFLFLIPTLRPPHTTVVKLRYLKSDKMRLLCVTDANLFLWKLAKTMLWERPDCVLKFWIEFYFLTVLTRKALDGQ